MAIDNAATFTSLVSAAGTYYGFESVFSKKRKRTVFTTVGFLALICLSLFMTPPQHVRHTKHAIYSPVDASYSDDYCANAYTSGDLIKRLYCNFEKAVSARFYHWIMSANPIKYLGFSGLAGEIAAEGVTRTRRKKPKVEEGRKPLVPVVINNLRNLPKEEVFFHNETAKKINEDASESNGKLILSNHRVIFDDSKHFHEYPLIGVSQYDESDATDDLVLRFPGNNKVHLKANKTARDKFKRIWKGDY
jgi:hypothetical protein